MVGLYRNGVVQVDADAAGAGWFVDPTPATDAEFTGTVAAPGSPAFGLVDLLSVLSHEIGHGLGYDDVYDGADHLMDGALTTGMRRIELPVTVGSSTLPIGTAPMRVSSAASGAGKPAALPTMGLARGLVARLRRLAPVPAVANFGLDTRGVAGGTDRALDVQAVDRARRVARPGPDREAAQPLA